MKIFNLLYFFYYKIFPYFLTPIIYHKYPVFKQNYLYYSLLAIPSYFANYYNLKISFLFYLL